MQSPNGESHTIGLCIWCGELCSCICGCWFLCVAVVDVIRVVRVVDIVTVVHALAAYVVIGLFML